jgi:predicted phosphodiesterase
MSWRDRTRRLLRAVALASCALVLAGAAMTAGWRLAGPSESDTELGRVSFKVGADAFGQIDAYVPIADWGVRADAFDAPFELAVEIRSLDRRGALEAAGGERAAIDRTRDDLEGSARSAVVRGFAFGLGTVLLLAFVLWLLRARSRRFALLAIGVAVTGVAGAAASLALAVATFDSRAFSAPSYYGRGPELAQLLAFFERQQENDRYSATFDNAIENFSAYLADAPRVGEGSDRAIFFGSDLHSNLPILSSLGEFVGTEPFILAGDFGTSGSESETKVIVPRIADLTGEVVAVSGNHDSALLMDALEAAGVSVVASQGEPVDVEGLSVDGFSDPLEWQGANPSSAERIYSFPELEDGEELLAQAKEDAVTWFDGLERKPDIALVHQNSIAQHLAGTLAEAGYDEPLTIVTGHNHLQSIDRYAGGRINVVNAGTLGAGGPLRVGQESAGLGELHFADRTPELRSVDLILIEPLSGQAQAERVVLDVACPPRDAGVEPCRYEPS